MSDDDLPPFDDLPHPAELPADEPAPQPRRHSEPRPTLETVKPPHSLEAEREVLSAVLIDGAALETLAARMTVADLYSPAHRAVFDAMLELRRRMVPVDLITLRQQLIDLGTFERAGGSRIIGELLDRGGTVDNLGHYLGIVLDKSRLRRLVDVARSIEAQALGDVADVDAFIAGVQARWGTTVEQIAPAVTTIPLLSITEAHGVGSWLERAPAEASVLLHTSQGQPFIRDGRVGTLSAPGGRGKSFALVQLAAAVASGTPWLDTYRVASKGRVLLALGEEDEDEIWRRLYRGTRHLCSYERDEVARNVVPLPLAGRDCAFLRRAENGNIEQTDFFRALKASMAQGHWRLCIFDPLSRFGGPEVETDAHAATRLVQCFEELTALPGRPAVINAHHERKPSGQGGAARDASNMRGSSALVDGPRWVGALGLYRGGKLLELRVTKANYTMPGEPLILAREKTGVLRPATPVEIAEADEDGRGEAKPKRIGREENTL